MVAGLLIAHRLSRSVRVARAEWPRLIAMAVAGFGSSWFTIEGFARIAAGVGTVVGMIEPIMISLLAWLLLREKPGTGVWLGLAIAAGGSIVLFWPDISASTQTPVDPLGLLFMIAASASFALYTILGKPLVVRHNAFTITAGRC